MKKDNYFFYCLLIIIIAVGYYFWAKRLNTNRYDDLAVGGRMELVGMGMYIEDMPAATEDVAIVPLLNDKDSGIYRFNKIYKHKIIIITND